MLDAIQTAFAGTVVNQVYEKDRAVDVVALLPRRGARQIRRRCARCRCARPPGPFVTLGDVAQIYLATGRAAIRHQAGQRFASVTFNAGSRGIDGVAADVRTHRATRRQTTRRAPGWSSAARPRRSRPRGATWCCIRWWRSASS